MDIAFCHRRKFGQVWGSTAAMVRRTEKLTDLENSLALALQRRLNSISLQCIPWPVTCSEWGACLTDFRFQILGKMTPKVKIFPNVFPDSSTGHRDSLRFVAKFGENQPWHLAKLPKGRVDYHTKKTRAPRDSSQPPFCPKWADRAQNFLNVVTLWHVHIYQIWFGSAAFCRSYSGKINFLAQKINT